MTRLPHLANVKTLCKRLSLQSAAELAEGHSDEALADVKLELALADSIRVGSIPDFVSGAVGQCASRHSAGMGRPGGASMERGAVEELPGALSGFNFVAETDHAIQNERTAGVLLAELAPKLGMTSIYEISSSFTQMFTGKGADHSTDQEVSLLALPTPSGWLRLEEVNYSKAVDKYFQGVMDAGAKSMKPSQFAVNYDELVRQMGSGGSLLEDLAASPHRGGGLCHPSEHSSHQRRWGATAANEAALACALERYRLANGQFPDTLAALAPKFMEQIPNDVTTGQPYKYRRTPDGQFVLYSLGWAGKDDGGTPGDTLFDSEKGDWVWSYPAE